MQKKSNVTGSVASIKTDDFNDLNMDVSHVIQGRVQVSMFPMGILSFVERLLSMAQIRCGSWMECRVALLILMI